jgi:hypothetical protein
MKMSDSPGEELSNVAITRHAAFWLNGVIPVEQQSQVSDEIQDFFYPHFKNYIHADPRDRENIRLAIEKYLYQEDPIGISDESDKNVDEYRPEADLIAWLLISGSLTPKTLSALWIVQFSKEISPYKSEEDSKILAMIESLNQIYRANRGKDLR